MADPDVQALTKDVWTKVADNVTTGYVHILETGPNQYLQTYRDTGNPPPTTKAEAVNVPPQGIAISSTTAIDVYIMPVGKDGGVRVDIP